LPLLNEKVMCALGRGIAASGRLNPDGVDLAFSNLQRFVALARALSVDHIVIIATAAVRDASDGAAFVAEAERQCGVPVRVVGGAWRAIARLHMEQTGYPLHIIHQYTLRRRPAESFLEIIDRQSRRSLERIATINRRRLEVVPLAAAILRRLIAAARPDRVIL